MNKPPKPGPHGATDPLADLFLFPERFSAEKLADLKETMGSAAYGCQMLNDPSGLEGSDFKVAWLEQGRYEHLPDRPTVFSGVDLAIGRSEGHSRFAIVTVALDRDNTVYVAHAYRDRIPFVEQLGAVKRIHRHHRPRLIAIEANGYSFRGPSPTTCSTPCGSRSRRSRPSGPRRASPTWTTCPMMIRPTRS